MNPQGGVSLKEYFAGNLRAYLVLIVICIILTAVCFLLFFIEQHGIPVKQYLQLSPSNLWGIFTLIFVHNGWEHLYANIATLWVLLALLLMLNSLHPIQEKRKGAEYFVITIFASAIVAHSVWYVLAYIMNPGNTAASAGASGLTYAFMGAIIALSVINGLHAFSKRSTAADKRLARTVLILNGVVAGMLLAMLLLLPDFIGGASSNRLGHFLALVLGIFGIMLMDGFLKRDKSLAVRLD